MRDSDGSRNHWDVYLNLPSQSKLLRCSHHFSKISYWNLKMQGLTLPLQCETHGAENEFVTV